MKFKCKLSGVVVEFTQEADIQTTLQNENYEVYQEPVVEVKKESKKEVKSATEE